MIAENALAVMEKLEQSGFEAYAVGGCVRDRLLGQEPQDWDIATSALPQQTAECFTGYKINTRGLKHGTVGVILGGEMIEITTYRIDGEYGDHRHPESVEYTPLLNLDLARRDFTVNAMAMDKYGNITDPFGGQADLKEKIIRCVGDADVRFKEDALRIMRGLRFASAKGFSLEEKTLKSACNRAKDLQNIAVERIFAELKKMLLKENAGNIIRQTLPVFKVILPTLKVTDDQWEKVSECIGRTDSFVLKLYFLLEYSDAKDELLRLKAENTLKKQIDTLVKMKDIPLKKSRVYLQKLMCAYGRENVLLLCTLRETELNENYTFFAEKASMGCTSVQELDIGGDELKQAGIYRYKIKETLQKLLTATVEGKCKNENGALKAYLEEMRKNG